MSAGISLSARRVRPECGGWNTVTPWGRCQEAGSQNHAADWCLSGEADSHQPKAPIERRRAKPVFRRQREPGGSPLRPKKNGLEGSGRWHGALRGVPVRWVAPYEVGAKRKALPLKTLTACRSQIVIVSNWRSNGCGYTRTQKISVLHLQSRSLDYSMAGKTRIRYELCRSSKN